jgi:hypothetical protein
MERQLEDAGLHFEIIGQPGREVEIEGSDDEECRRTEHQIT